ncbi:peptidylprolyl isomerase [Prosthecochloris sp. N3]|uniref:Peptidyl-prolyl cis-trans isomerase n=1 Tax=Prosthecochloris ethylica TaxID=2743976 RepID=A0ABR9XNP4_9CHLB|nr:MULTISPECIES: peptidylprolyl isomerase [Prosthecochloris]MEC9486549.1 peptidylprolyl isomerase [Prosthecochloris sp.]MBF0585749.1 peptidylprolyl isomerase [Prosthecochloris ethylica]MBF0635659.1 peptidylprolyl isomerase [Prosthecochloris ethylica]NUK46958.1 peptidylprolyl isomerase [Prosthecochloris ethylica]RNA65450.1 peptidylprolyl isomerase [Prosthecochloris sp. ZM_2]
MAEAKQGDKVKVHYTGKLGDGSVFDSSVEREPLEFTIGEGAVIPGFEQAVVGLEPGGKTETTIEADNAYGQHSQDLVTEVPRERMPQDLQVTIGQQLQVSMANGQNAIVLVTDVSDTAVTIDANHPLAGQDLTFSIELVEIV